MNYIIFFPQKENEKVVFIARVEQNFGTVKYLASTSILLEGLSSWDC